MLASNAPDYTPFQYGAAAFKVARVSEPISPVMLQIETPKDTISVWQRIVATNLIIDTDKENLIVITVNTRHFMLGYSLISIGSLNEAFAHPREIMRPVITSAAQSFILLHNHPSGDPSPSEPDRALTRRIQECANLFQIVLLDHVIAGEMPVPDCPPRNPPYYSFREVELI